MVLIVVAVPTLFLTSPAYLAFADRMPDVQKLSQAIPADTVIYAADGTTVLADLHDPGYQHYDQPLSEMGALLPNAIVAIEDRNFYSEPGVDPGGVARAAVVDWRAHGNVEGASTITQQLVKIRLVGPEPTLDRKLREALLSFEAERTYTKQQILEMYLNSAFFGNSAWGGEAAAKIYFHKDTSELDLAQASMLAGLVRGPTVYNPLLNWKSAKARQLRVLNAMVRVSSITGTEAAQAYAEDISPPLHMFTPTNRIVATGFVRYVVGQLVSQFGPDITYGGGLKVMTTINLKLQGIAQSAITNGVARLAYRRVSQGALVAIDPTTGAIVAMVASANPSVNGGQYNLAVWPPRNPGSSMKIFTYTAAIASKRFTMVTPIRDSSFTYRDPTSGEAYTPRNYDGRYHGTCQLQACMGNSLNIPAVKVELGIGVSSVVSMARTMGAPPYQLRYDASGNPLYTTDDPLNTYGPSLTLGGYGETPLQMATGASVLAAQGLLRQPYAIETISRDGTFFYQHKKDPGVQVVDPRVAFIMEQIMSNDRNRQMIFGLNSLLTLPGRHVGVKTGTSDSFADAWTVGYTPHLVAAVWTG
ncbi:MAG TPA: transglycosylase domain-containing protein, partial [Candidatus Dormibacteraeota bacterium]|nr:transglycosylase domain-containing protein [Candidatus Dormibacteraeota bacterium]